MVKLVELASEKGPIHYSFSIGFQDSVNEPPTKNLASSIGRIPLVSVSWPTLLEQLTSPHHLKKMSDVF